MDTVVRRFTPDDQQPVQPDDTVVLETTSTWHDTIRFYEQCGFTITHVTDGRFGSDTWFASDLRGQR